MIGYRPSAPTWMPVFGVVLWDKRESVILWLIDTSDSLNNVSIHLFPFLIYGSFEDISLSLSFSVLNGWQTQISKNKSKDFASCSALQTLFVAFGIQTCQCWDWQVRRLGIQADGWSQTGAETTWRLYSEKTPNQLSPHTPVRKLNVCLYIW